MLRAGNIGAQFGSAPIHNDSSLLYQGPPEPRQRGDTRRGLFMNAYRKVYQALDAALASGERAVAPGTEAAVQAAIAELRAEGGPREAMERLQEISVDLARLNGALRDGDEREWMVQRARLAAVKEEWLKSAPVH